MELIKPGINLDFIGKRTIAISLSVVILLIGFVSLLIKGGPNYGIDFAGGTLIQVQIHTETDAAEIKTAFKDVEMESVSVQHFGDEGNEFLIRTPVSSDREDLSEDVSTALGNSFGEENFNVRRVEMVGPQVGQELRKKGLLAIAYAMIGILIYVTWRFEFRFALGAIIALFHDVLITLGVFSLFNREIDLPIIAAFLAIIGYSLNDTIIVYDRIRENRGRHSQQGFKAVVNRSINETLSRTVLTSGTSLLVVLSLFFLGGGVIHNFAFALLIGILVGTYSSIFVASPVLVFWEDYKKSRPAETA
ncbi:MAG TPA: protein translocase subunit SecF [Desulfuromonadales bacterium]|nr:protein translocase subunit SecF [Desulfuromonadales bacterium]